MKNLSMYLLSEPSPSGKTLSEPSPSGKTLCEPSPSGKALSEPSPSGKTLFLGSYSFICAVKNKEGLTPLYPGISLLFKTGKDLKIS